MIPSGHGDLGRAVEVPTVERAKPEDAGRTGPRPFALHMATAAAVWGGAVGASAAAGPAARVLWHPSIASETGGPSAAPDAVAAAAAARLASFHAAVARYREHPFRRTADAPEIVAEIGAARLLAYGEGPRAALFVPSLVNRYYVADLSGRRSFVRWFAARGWRVFVVDWGRPGTAELGYDIDDYVVRVLEPLAEAAGRPDVAIGYCMGGLLALALCARRPRMFSGLVLLATPWDFAGGSAGMPGAWFRAVENMLESEGAMSVDALQSCFYALDPLLVLRKFVAFADVPRDSEREYAFVELEDWVNDGVPLPAPAARTCFGGWYGRNDPVRGCWRVAGEAVRPEAVDLPAYVVAPTGDRLVPSASSLPLARILPRATVRRPRMGHLGLMASATADRRVWRPLLAWMRRFAVTAGV